VLAPNGRGAALYKMQGAAFRLQREDDNAMPSEEDRFFDMFQGSLGSDVTITTRHIIPGKAIVTILAKFIPLGAAAQKVIAAVGNYREFFTDGNFGLEITITVESDDFPKTVKIEIPSLAKQ
jgi:hypothetical protein